MSALLLALALLAQDASAAPAAAAPAPAAEELPWPAGAPRDDYGLVSWCYGVLGGYLELHDQVMPEVTRIETAFRSPDSTLAEDLKVYADMQRQSRADLQLFARAMEAAEKASIKPINTLGAAAVKRGRATWAAAPNLPKARLAQEWMSWSLPVRCGPTAERLEQRAKLLGATFDPAAEAVAMEPPPAPEPEASAAAPPT
jgi:hypothetical protein